MINQKTFALKCKNQHAFSVEDGEHISESYEVMLAIPEDPNLRVAKRRFVVCPFCEENVYALSESQEKVLKYFSNQSEANLYAKDLNENDI